MNNKLIIYPQKGEREFLKSFTLFFSRISENDDTYKQKAILEHKSKTRNRIEEYKMKEFHIGAKELQGKSCNDIQDMLFTQKGVNWNDFPTYCKRGTCCLYKNGMWTLETEMPILVNEGRQFLEDIVNSTEE